MPLAVGLILAVIAVLMLRTRTAEQAPAGLAPAAAALEPSPGEPASATLERESIESMRSELPPAVDWSAGSGPLQLSGRVLDEHGVPLVGANVMVAEYGPAKPGIVNCLTDAQGRFEAHGSWSSDQLVLRAIHAECWNAVQKTVGRRAEVELALEHGATLSGRFATEHQEPLPDLSFALKNTDTGGLTYATLPFGTNPDEVRRRVGAAVECALDGSFSVRGLRPGRYSLDVDAKGVRGAVASLAEIDLHAGEMWSGAGCNPLVLHLPAPVELALEVGPVLPGLEAGARLLIYFSAVGEAAASEEQPASRFSRNREGSTQFLGYPELPSAIVIPGEIARVQLPSAGKRELLVFLERPSNEGPPVLLPIEALERHFIEIPDGQRSVQLRFELDTVQCAALLASSVR